MFSRRWILRLVVTGLSVATIATATALTPSARTEALASSGGATHGGQATEMNMSTSEHNAHGEAAEQPAPESGPSDHDEGKVDSHGGGATDSHSAATDSRGTEAGAHEGAGSHGTASSPAADDTGRDWIAKANLVSVLAIIGFLGLRGRADIKKRTSKSHNTSPEA